MRALENSYSGTIIFTAKFANTEKDFDMLVKGITSQLGEVEKLLLIPQTSERFIDIRRSLDKNASELLSGENIIVSA
ncbi:MAG: hypothetical protein LBG59_03525 [Candidatus Peribacteria bacterium]|jgi:hypothetical protein|nr:hypothetical protein [Candidatus Peribacteria bacterium]